MIYVQCKRCDVIYPANREHVCAQNNKPSTKPTTKPVIPTEMKSQASKPGDRIEEPPKPGFDRATYQRKYMRAYMRVRRARQKDQE